MSIAIKERQPSTDKAKYSRLRKLASKNMPAIMAIACMGSSIAITETLYGIFGAPISKYCRIDADKQKAKIVKQIIAHPGGLLKAHVLREKDTSGSTPELTLVRWRDSVATPEGTNPLPLTCGDSKVVEYLSIHPERIASGDDSFADTLRASIPSLEIVKGLDSKENAGVSTELTTRQLRIPTLAEAQRGYGLTDSHNNSYGRPFGP